MDAVFQCIFKAVFLKVDVDEFHIFHRKIQSDRYIFKQLENLVTNLLNKFQMLLPIIELDRIKSKVASSLKHMYFKITAQ